MLCSLCELSYTTIAIILSAFVAIYYYLTRNHNYWSSRGIKGPKPIILFGNLHHIFFNNFGDVEEKRLAKYGRIYGMFFGPKPHLVVAEPELIKDIMVKDFNKFVNRRDNDDMIDDPVFSRALTVVNDDDWKRSRSIISPTFSSGKMKRMHKLVEQCVDSLDVKLESVAKSDKEVEIKKVMGDYTMDVIASCAFATKTDTHNEPNNPFVTHAMKLFSTQIWRSLLFMAIPRLGKALRISVIDTTVMNFFNKAILEIMNQRKSAKKGKYDDFLQLMMNAKNNQTLDESEDTLNDLESHHGMDSKEKLIDSKTRVQMTDNDILANGFLFFLAGYETTANLLGHLIYCLAINPECQRRLYEEVMENSNQKGTIEYETIAQMPYLDACISETLRLHNPAPQTGRVTSEEYKLGDTGITLPKGTQIMIPIHAIHHSPDFYPNPHRFDPNRFMPENRDQLIPYTYLPFGAGPRNCVGMRFALMEAKTAIVRLIPKYEFSRTPNTKIPLKMKSSMMMIPTDITVGVRLRS